MSYDINFWKLSRPLDARPQDIYAELCEGNSVEGLAELPIRDILSRVAAAFPDFNPDDDFPAIRLENSHIEVNHSLQHVRFDIRGELDSSLNKLVDILADFGCPMYDPQLNERYDRDNGLALGDPPKFEDWTDEQRQARDRQMAAMLAAIDRQQKKPGCGSACLLLLALAGGLWRIFCLLLLMAAPLAADEIDDYVEAQRIEQRIPGLALLVVDKGEVVKQRGFGLANVEHQVPVKPETIFQSGSVGKQFTAAAVLLLVEDGKLALDDSVRKYLTDAPEAWQPMTVRHLLSHTSGLRNMPTDFDFRREYSEDELLKILYGLRLAAKPGYAWAYSNPGYVTLGILIHKVSGQFYGDVLKDRVFTPLGMTSTGIISEQDIVPNRAAGYRLVKGELKNQEWVSPSMNTTADGSLYFNLVALVKWDAALAGDRFLSAASRHEMWTPQLLLSGKPNPAGYGFGWMCRDTPGHRLVQHGGAWQGFTTFIARYLDDRLTVVVLTNLSSDSNSNPGKIARHVAELYRPALNEVDEKSEE
jgi:CubicO group peptidase (beta-lactamase class C family)